MASTKPAGVKPDFTNPRLYIPVEPDGSNLTDIRHEYEQLVIERQADHGLQSWGPGRIRLYLPSLDEVALFDWYLGKVPSQLLRQLFWNRRSGCLESSRTQDANGYSLVDYEGRRWRLHRLMYQLIKDAKSQRFQSLDGFRLVPDSGNMRRHHVVDHRCRVHHCCNYLQLEAVTRPVNTRRGRDDRHFTNQQQLVKP